MCCTSIKGTQTVLAFKAAPEDTRGGREQHERLHQIPWSPAAESFGQDRAWLSRVMYNACNDAGAEFVELKEGQKSTPYETPSMFTFAWEWNSFLCSAG